MSLPPRKARVLEFEKNRRRVGGSTAFVLTIVVVLFARVLGADEPSAQEDSAAVEAAAESLVIDPSFTAELFRNHKPAQKTLPDAEEAVAGDGGNMPEATSEEVATAEVEASPKETLPSDPSDPLSPELQALRQKVRRTLGYYHRRQLNTRDHTPWEVFHQIVAFGDETLVRRDGPKGESVDAVRWLCDNRAARGQKLMHLERGKLTLARGKGIQGHYGQFLAILAQHDTPTDYPIEVDGRKFTIEDLIRTEQRTCRKGEELTFKLIAFSHYLKPGATWKNDRGETWTIERVLRDEIGSPIRGAACGGTHRLMGLSYAVARRAELEQPLDGEYGRASKYLHDYHRYAFSLQNEDGSFSTEWFAGRGNRDDRDRKLQTTGHITEWLAYSLPTEHLTEPQMVKAIDFLATLLESDRKAAWAIGPLGHSLHALALFDERVFIAAENGEGKLAQAPPKLQVPIEESVKPAEEQAETKPEIDESEEGESEEAEMDDASVDTIESDEDE